MDENLVLIRQYKLCKRGLRGCTICLPSCWVNSNGLEKGDKLNLYQAPGSSDIIIRIHKEKENG